MKSQARLAIESLLIISFCTAVIIFAEWKLSTSSEAAESAPRASISLEPPDSPALRTFEPSKSWSGVTLIPQSGTEKVLLVSHTGETIHEWELDAPRARLLENCNLLVLHGTKWGLAQPRWNQLRQIVREYSWDGSIEWEYRVQKKAHHDLQRLQNGNTLILERLSVPDEWKAKVKDPIRRSSNIRADGIREVNQEGETVWQWKSYEHLDLNSCGRFNCENYPAKGGKDRDKLFDWTHSNTISVLPENKWYKAGDNRFKPGNILLIPRNWSTVLLIDKDTGDIVWKYTGDYKGGIGGGHDSHMIEKGLPGAGNILVFDNGRELDRNSSIALEINPQTKQTVWKFEDGENFYSHAAGSLQRLPNGNTLISEDVPGRIFEVTFAGEIVWEYQSSVRTCRARRYASDFCPKLVSLIN